MKALLLAAVLLVGTAGMAQSYQNRVYEAKYLDKPPVFIAGPDSLQRFYYTHFPAFDTVIAKAVQNGDTAKYLRIYFSFQVDENGFAYEPAFERVASTRSRVTESAKTIRYFQEMKQLLQGAVESMFKSMPPWRPGLNNGIPVKTLNYDFIQVWVGLSAPQ